jgi:hypothetical protein
MSVQGLRFPEQPPALSGGEGRDLGHYPSEGKASFSRGCPILRLPGRRGTFPVSRGILPAHRGVVPG